MSIKSQCTAEVNPNSKEYKLHAHDYRKRFEALKQRRVEITEKVAKAEKKKQYRLKVKLAKAEAAKRNKTTEKLCTLTPEEKEKEDKIRERWDELRPYLNVNSHLATRTYEHDIPQTSVEAAINSAVGAGDVSLAEEISDHLAETEFQNCVTAAISAKEYTEGERAKEAEKRAKKRKKLQWTFQNKQRWETKSNMGYM